MSNETKIPTRWTKPRPQPQEPEIDWVSLEKLLDEYTIPVLAEAVEKLNVLTHDDAGRRILATNGDASDTKSKAFALRHLELDTQCKMTQVQMIIYMMKCLKPMEVHWIYSVG